MVFLHPCCLIGGEVSQPNHSCCSGKWIYSFKFLVSFKVLKRVRQEQEPET